MSKGDVEDYETQFGMSILTKKKFNKLVEERVLKTNQGYIDSVLEICKERGIDPEDINPLLTQTLTDKIEAEAINQRLIKGNYNQLPL